MFKPEVRVFPNLEELSRQAAECFVGLADRRARAGEIFAAALSGGATPRRLYGLLASRDYAERIPWERVHLFQVDERCVPPDHPASNYRMVRERLLSQVPISAADFHRMPAESSDLEEAARQYAEEMKRVLQPKPGEPPRLDLVLLGMGEDGHTASLFPLSPAVKEQGSWVRAHYVAKLRMHRMTVTFPVLNAAAQIIFLVSGVEKAETLRRVLEEPAQPELYPAQGIQPVNGQVSWYVDEAAARLLSDARRSMA